MAGRDVVLRVRLDTGDAQRDLRGLFGGGSGGAPIAPGAGGGGNASPSAGGGGGARGGDVGGGGFNIGPLLAKIAAAVGAQQMIGTTGGVALGAGKDALRDMLLGGGRLGMARGAVAARDMVSNEFGLAHKLGLVSDETLRARFKTEMNYGVGAQVQGAAGAKNALNGAVLGMLGAEAGEILTDAVPILGEIRDAITALLAIESSKPEGAP